MLQSIVLSNTPEEEEVTMKWLPNIVSSFRLVASFFVPFYAVKGAWLMATAWIIAGYLSDLLDGILARKLKAETFAGKIIDLTTDVVFDWSIISGLVLSKEISWVLAGIMVPAIVLVRIPAFFEPKSIFFKVGFVLYLFSTPCLIWLIGSRYVLKAVGASNMVLLLIFAIAVAILFFRLKKDRIGEEIKKIKEAFFSA